MKRELETTITACVQALFKTELDAELTRPEEQFGDYATNVALILAKQLGKNPREVAQTLIIKLREDLKDKVTDISVAGPGFINLKLSDKALREMIATKPTRSLTGQTIVAEYSDPNPFKMLHAGHVYTTIVGDAIANLMEAAGGNVHRVNYGGDVGLHVAKTMWAILKRLGGEVPERLTDIEQSVRPDWLASAYVEGNSSYENDQDAKAKIVELNKQVYKLHADNDHDSPFAKIYWTCREWSYEAFDIFYERLGTKIEKYYPESEVSGLGLATVKQQIGNVFTESDGAIIFDGEKYGLHTRVFINRHGLPTYEAKEVGLILKKNEDYHFDRSVVVTANEQEQYMIVVLKAIEQFLPDLVQASVHIPHGMVKLASGVKMSSRLGNIIPADEVLRVTSEAIKAANRPPDDITMLGAVKYAFLKTRLGGDLIYDPKESVSLEGNSGPYLQYAHARARSILRKVQPSNHSDHNKAPTIETKPVLQEEALDSGERSLLRKISEFPETLDRSVAEFMPHYICTYLYELAQVFNRFYEHNRVIGDPRQDIRLILVASYAETLKDGLRLLGIAAPDKM